MDQKERLHKEVTEKLVIKHGKNKKIQEGDQEKTKTKYKEKVVAFVKLRE